MKTQSLSVQDALLMEFPVFSDDRGSLVRHFYTEDLNKLGLPTDIKQSYHSTNLKRGTLRGLHFQVAPQQEYKYVHCTRGSIFDVIVDLRPHSPTYLKWHGEILKADSHLGLYIPAGFAHGYQTLEDQSEVAYLVTAGFSAQHYRGIRYDDPQLCIDWPLPVSSISPKDVALPLLRSFLS